MRERSVGRMPPSFQAEDACNLEGLAHGLPKRFMSLANLHQLCQDFGILPDLCDMTGVQVCFIVQLGVPFHFSVARALHGAACDTFEIVYPRVPKFSTYGK